MLNMRTESANCGGGSTAIVSHPAVLSNKSAQDVEAAYAIAQLSEGNPRVTFCRPHQRDCHLTNGTPSPPRTSHVRTAVMPHAYSRVEKAAVKRKPDDVVSVESVAHKEPRVEQAVDSVQTAIKSERGSFMTTRRHPTLSRTDVAGDRQLVGRFVRTCGSSVRDDIQQQLYIRQSNHTVSPTLVSSVPSLFVTSSSGEHETGPDEQPPVFFPVVTCRSHTIPSVSHHQRHVLDRDSNDSLYRRNISVPSMRHIVPMAYNDGVQNVPGRDSFRSVTYEDHGSRRHNTLPSSLVSAYYSLGQSAAAAAASQLLAKKPTHSSVAVNNDRVQSTSISRSRRRLRPHVDSCTLDKVRLGQFGSLSTLRLYCSQLRRHSEPSPADVVKQSADDVAMDLSTRKQTAHGDEEPRSDSAWFRTSRSCCSSPGVQDDEVSSRRWTLGHLEQRLSAVERVRQQMSSVSLPCSPHSSHRHSDCHRSLVHQHQDSTAAATASDADVTERTCSDTTETSDMIPDSRLPLKKRRLHHHNHQQPALAVISEDSCDRQWTTEITVNEVSSSSSTPAASADCEVKESSADRLQSMILHADEDGDLPLHIAVAKGTTAAVDSIISVMSSFGVSLDYCNNRHQTALHLAVLTDQADIVRRLLDCGASSDVVDSRGQTCVHIAVLLGSTSCLYQLLRHSQHPLHLNAVSDDGMTALHLAVQRGNADAVRCLLSAGADVDVADTRYGRTALYYAVERNDLAVTELLVSYGANPALVTSSVPTASAAHARKCSTDMPKLLQPAISYLPACCPTG